MFSVGPIGPRRRRWVLPVLAVLAALVTAGGVVVAVRAYTRTGGPDGAVRGYLDALARADAPTALGYGTIPDGPRTFLRTAVLQQQQRIAPIHDISVRTLSQDGDRARVRARYSLGFASRPVDVDVTMGVHSSGGDWRLDKVAVDTQVQVVPAAQRATLAGSAVPEGTTLLFPGAVPVEFDTDYLQARTSQDVVSTDAGATTEVGVVLSAKGTAAALESVRTTVQACLRGSTDLRCPLPTERYVPGSVRGTLATPVADGLTAELASSAVGVIEIDGTVSVRGDYQRLEFDNTLTTRRNTTFALPVRGQGYVHAPFVLTLDRPE